MKKTLTLLGLVLVMICSMIVTGPTEVNAATTQENALNAYQRFLNKKKQQYTDYRFCLVNVNKDNIPELVIGPKFAPHVSHGEVYTYSGGKVKELTGAGSDYGRFLYVPKKKVTLTESQVNGYGVVDTYYSWNSKWKRKKIVTLEDYYDRNSNKQKYKINKKKVSKKKYNKKLKSLKKKYKIKSLSSGSFYEINDTNLGKLTPARYKSLLR